MRAIVVYRPEPHKCDLPDPLHLPDGTVAWCPECDKFSMRDYGFPRWRCMWFQRAARRKYAPKSWGQQ